MFNQILDFIISIWDYLNPCYIIREYQEGIILRFGKYNRKCEKGLHFKIPCIEEALIQHILITTVSLSAQSLLTKDGKNIVVKAIVKYKVVDVKTFLIEVFDAIDTITDISQGVIKNVIMDRTLQECLLNELDSVLTKKIRNEIKKYGVDIQQVTLIDISPMKSLRLINDNTSLQLN